MAITIRQRSTGITGSSGKKSDNEKKQIVIRQRSTGQAGSSVGESSGGLIHVPQPWLDTITPVSSPSRSTKRWSGTTPSSRGGGFGETESQGEGYFTQSRQNPLERAARAVSSAASSYLGGFANVGGEAAAAQRNLWRESTQESVSEWQREIDNWRRNLDEWRADGTLTDQEEQFLNQLIRGNQERIAQYTTAQRGREETVGAARDLADQWAARGEKERQAASAGLNGLGRLAVDTGIGLAQYAGDVGIGALTGGSAMVPMAIRSFGGGAQQARLDGADDGQAALFGLASAALESVTEGLGSVGRINSRFFGEGALDEIMEGMVAALERKGSTSVGRAALNRIGTAATAFVSEGAEEALSSLVSPILERAIYSDEPLDVGEILGDALYDFAVGGTIGAIAGGVGGTNTTGAQAQARTRFADQAITDAYNEMSRSGMFSPASTRARAEAASYLDNVSPSARQAVEMLSQGEEISGNQATRIARDPEALSLLRELTGQEINTDAPISQVKADIRAVAGTRSSAQEERRADGDIGPYGGESRPAAQRVYDVNRVRGAASSTGLGESGQRAISAAYDGSVDADRYYAGFTAYYEAGLSGRSQDQVRSDYAADLTEAQRYAAYAAGQNDAAASLQREKRAAQFAQTAGEDSGLVYDDFVREAVESGRTVSGESGSGPVYLTQETAERVNSVAKALGLRVRFVDQVDGGRANAEITGSEVQIEKNNPLPVQFLMGHEVTHRLQELAPEEYRAFREAAAQDEMVQAYVRRYTEGDTGLSYEQALDEASADYAGRLLEDGELLDQFIGRNQDNRTLLEKVRDAIRTLVRRLTGAEKKAAQTAEGKLSAALEAGAKRAETLQERQGDGRMDTTRNSLKEDGDHGRAREETGAEFERRCLEEGYQVLAGADTRYGYRGVRSAGEAAGQVQAELERLGVPCFVKEGAVLKNNGTKTVVLKSPQATTLSVGRIAIDNNITLPPKNVAGHEAFHFWKGLDGRDSYIETVLENLDFTSETFQEYQSSISRAMFQGEVDLSDQRQFDQLMEEIFAYISGDIHEGTNEADLRPMFRDFDAVRAAWENLVEENRGRTARSRYSLKEDGANGRERVQQEDEGILREDDARAEEEDRGRDPGDGEVRSVPIGERYRGVDPTYGENPVRTWVSDGLVTPEPGSLAESEQQTAAEYGIPSFVVSDAVWDQNKGGTPAFSAEGQIYLRENLPEAGRGTYVPHEATHVMKQVGYQPYLDFTQRVPDMLDLSSTEAHMLLNGVGEHRGIDPLDMTEEQAGILFDEVNATIYGSIAAGDEVLLTYVRPAFQNFDAYTAELTQIHEQFKQERGGTQARESRKGFSVDRELDREIRQIVKEAREGGRSETEVRRAIRDTMDRALERQKEQQRATQRAARGRRSARELRERIERHVAKLSKNLRKPTDKQHIPEQLRTAVAAMLDAINLESVYTVDPETGKRRKGGEGAPTKRTEAFRALREQYEAILNRPDDYSYMGVLDPNLMDNLAEVIRMRDTPLFEMSLDQLTTVWKTVKGVEASITSANKLLGENRYAGVAELAYGIRESSRGKRAKNNYGGSGLGRITGFGDQLLNTDMMNSLTFLHLFGDGGDALYHELQAARDQKTRIMQETVRLAKQVVGKTNVDKIQKKIHTFQLEGGELKLSTAQLMSLYELNQRQQAQDHIYKGGIHPGPRSSSVSRDKSPGENVAAVLGRMDAPSSVVRVTQADVVNMLSELSEEEIRIADGLQSIMQGYLADEGNRESMKVYGYEKFTEDHYFPISSDPNQVQSKIGDILEGGERRPVSVSEWGSAKSTVTGANNGLLLGDIFDVFAQHAVDMSTYASHLGVLEDVNRVRNFAFRNAEGHRSGTIKEIIQRVAGKGGNAYLDKLLQDISRGTARGGVAGLSRLTANYKAASVGLNLRVALQQPTSYARALAAMSPKYLADPRVLKPGGWKKALKYAPIAQWKDWGNFEINQGRQFQNILFDTDGTMDRLRNRAMTLASVMDSATWGRLWNACELEILDTRPSIQKGSEEFYSAVAQRFTDVVDQTQVVDNVLGRSQFMRSSDNLAKMAASYMGEPTQTYNMLYRAYRDTVQEQDPKKRSQAIKRLGRTAAAVTFSAFMTAVAAAFWDGVRDDEDRDEKYWERVLKHIGPNFAQNVNPVGMLPYARDILSIVQGYDVSRMDLEAVTSLFSALQNMQKAVNGEGRYTVRGAALNLAAELSRITGLPLATVKRDAEAIARAVGVETEDWYFQYQVERALNSVFYSGNRGEFYDIAFGALADGELDVYEQITQDLMSSGVKGSTIEGAMRSRLKAAQESDPNFSMSQAGQDLIGGRPQYHVEAEEKGSFSADDLSPEARTNYNEQRAGDYREWVNALEGNGGFEKLDDEGKDKLLSAADQLASDIALRDHSQGAFTETDMDQWERWATKGAEYGVDPSEALLFKAAYDMAEGEKDEDGKTISGSKKENALELAADLMPWLTDRELEYLMSNYWTPEDRELKEMKEGKFLG